MLLVVLVSAQDPAQKYMPGAAFPTGIHPTTTEAIQNQRMMEKQDADQIRSHLQQRQKDMSDRVQRAMKSREELEIHRMKMGNLKEKDNYRRKFIDFIKKDPYANQVKELTEGEKRELKNFRTFMKAADKPFDLKKFYGMEKKKEDEEFFGPKGLKMNGVDGFFNGGQDWYKKRIEWLSKNGPGMDEEGRGYLNNKFFNRESITQHKK